MQIDEQADQDEVKFRVARVEPDCSLNNASQDFETKQNNSLRSS